MPKPTVLYSLLVVQLLCIVAVLFVPFGFDHPSSWGLDFGHFLLVAGVHCMALFAGFVAACVLRRWLLAGLQVLVTAAVFMVITTGVFGYY